MGREEFQINACLCILAAADVFTRIIGPVLVVLALCLISLFTVTFFDILIAYHALSTVPYWTLTAVGLGLLCGMLSNYSSAVLTSPGLVDPSAPQNALLPGSVDDSDDDYDDDDVRGARHGLVEDGRTMTLCKKCKSMRPPRAHHCHVCGQCVLKMDHHCPWINQCVGYNNYPAFWRTLAFATLGCAFIAAVSLGPFLHSMRDTSWPPLSEAWRYPGVRVLLAPKTRLSLCFALGLALSIAVGGLWAWHCFLLATNQTSIEFQQNRTTRKRLAHSGRLWRNPYDLGSWRANAREVFGSKGSLFLCLFWPLGSFPRVRTGDGLSFPTMDSAVAGTARRPLRPAGGVWAVGAASSRRPAGGSGATALRRGAVAEEPSSVGASGGAGPAFAV